MIDLFVKSGNITEFRGIKKCEKPLEFSDFSVLIGKNNSGKSAILEALSLLPLPDPSYMLPYYKALRIELIAELHSGRPSLVYGYSGKAKLTFDVKGTTWNFFLTTDGRISNFEISELVAKEGIMPNIAHKVARVLGIPLDTINLGDTLNSMVFFIPDDSSFIDKIAKNMENPENQNFITKTGAHTRVAQLINSCVDDKYSEVLFKPELSIRKELPENVLYIKVKDLGSGIEKLTSIFLWIEAIKPKLILWDDFEGSAHPLLIKQILNWLSEGISKNNWQVILSTHSIDVLNSLLEVRPQNAEVIQVKKGKDDVLTHTKLVLDELETLFDANQDPRILMGI